MNRLLAVEPGLWRRIEAVLDQVLDLDAAERCALLDEVCAADGELRAQVEDLLAADERPGGILRLEAAEVAAALLDDPIPDDEAPDADLIGREIGPYRLRREIGRGGMGVVYEAEDTRLGRRVAVKLLPAGYGRGRSARQRFLREARAASVLDHPNLATVHDVGEIDGRLFIVMAYYDGETLRTRLDRGPLSVEEACGIAIQLARGLARAHEAGIVHRDIKPANVILTHRGEVKILDFGLAKLAGDAAVTVTGESWGTPGYMAPEQACGEPTDARTDVWALGVVVYEMLAGRRPFRREGAGAPVDAVIAGEAEPLERVHPDVSRALSGAVARALARDPAERYSSAAGLLEDLEAGTARAAGRSPRRRRMIAAAVAGVTVAAAVVVAVAGRSALPWAPPPVRVAILAPALAGEGDNSELGAAAAEVLDAEVATLASIEGVAPLDPPDRGEAAGSELERLRAGEADEVLRTLIACRGGGCRVTLRRLDELDGAVLAAAGPFEIRTRVDQAQDLADAVRVHLLRLYSDRKLRPDLPGTRVRPEDYAAFADLDRRVDLGEPVGAEALERLDGLLRTSPDLLGAYLLAAGIARNLAEVDRAAEYAERARRLAPHDPRPLIHRVRIEVAGGRLDEAQATLERLAALAPGDARVRTMQAEMLEARGELAAAREVREELVRRRPTWLQVLALATLEVRLGEGDAARDRLIALLRTQPDNVYLLESLAYLEATVGDLGEAARIYDELAGLRPYGPYHGSLGFLRYLLGDHAAAAAAYRRALEIEPDDPTTLFNLAAALEAGGDLKAARALYRSLLEEFAASPPADARAGMLHAQCLARLGRRDEAARLAEAVLAETPEDRQVLHQAAQVHALLGERLPALFYAERCLKGGLRWEWFTIPEFAPLAGDPEFEALLSRHRTAAAAR